MSKEICFSDKTKRPTGLVTVIARHVKTGEETILFEDKFNLVVDTARKNMAKLLVGDGNSSGERYITKMSWGTGGVDVSNNPIPPDPTDTALAAEIASVGKKTVTYDFPNDTTLRLRGELLSTEANGEEVSEAGLWTDDDPDNPGGNILFARKTFGKLTKSASFEFIFLWKILL